MRITVKVPVDVDMAEVYALCRPISKRKCAEFVRQEVCMITELSATDFSGMWGWSEESLAHKLVEEGLAKSI